MNGVATKCVRLTKNAPKTPSHAAMEQEPTFEELARRFDVDLAPFPRLLEVEAHLQTLPPFVAAHPDAQPDAVKA